MFRHNGSIYRQVNKRYKAEYELLNSSGLYKELVSKKLLINHKEVTLSGYVLGKNGWKVLLPEQLSLISYPYEWTFGMLRDAALLTLQIQKIALSYGMSLKDASAFNIQFVKGKPVLIDTLSFEKYDEGKPWVAYKQFVEHFLCPLAVMSMVDIRLNRMTATFLDGIPVEIAAKLLPLRSRLNLSLLIHIVAHASTQKKYADKKLDKSVTNRTFSKTSLLGLVDSLEGTVTNLHWSPKGTQWEDYYEEDKNNYNDISFQHKGALVKEFLGGVKPKTVWDMGANTGYFSQIASEIASEVFSFDIDYGALEKHYRKISALPESKILPLFSDLTNPTPAVGWENDERMSLYQRGPADAILALALTHHLAISNNLPFSHIASGFAKIGKHLIVEFIEKEDSQVQILLANREDIFDEYTKEHFEAAFAEYFTIKRAVPIKGSKRVLYLMERK
ncbi:MAG: hypothetical protein RLZZ455_1030 [Candidatus Parcubacteria bacterium]